ncbi:RDD family protein [Methanoregula sp.]|uniref:RDD family protein n=1 Tax=Methanoregula sp. TaxID=2052170 RepID=UPI002371AFA3|nr:RDD family protein [Methanoregula sp.]MDD1686869.1 RDD family protein [Methanoregula sp.]
MTDPKNINDPIAWDQAGREYETQRDYTNAIRCFTHATELSPDYLDAWTHIAFLLIKMGLFEEAEKCKTQITRIKEKGSVETKKILNVVNVQELPQSPSSINATSIKESTTLKEMHYAGLDARFKAWIIDALCWWILLFILFIPGMLIRVIFGVNSIINAIFGFFLVFYIFIGGWMIFAWLESSHFSATPGKKIMNLHVTDPNGNRIAFSYSLIRNFIKFIPFINIISAFLMNNRPEKETIHDSIAKTRVLHDTIAEGELTNG